MKSEMRKAVQRRLRALVRYFSASPMSVLRSAGLKSRSSRMMSRICFLPFLGGMNFSTVPVKKIAPILSLLVVAEKASVAAI